MPTISRALTYLGMSTVKSLVLGFSLVDMTKSGDGDFQYVDYWQRCLFSAAAARRIGMARHACDPDEAFVGALMQDLGMLAMNARLQNDYVRVVDQARGDHRRLPTIEQEKFGFDHMEVGAELGIKWRLPEQLVEAIRQHHRPDDSAHNGLVRCVSLGFEIASSMMVPNPGPALAATEQHAKEWFNLGARDLRSMLQEIEADTKELATLFTVDTGKLPSIEAILAEAEDASLNHQLSMQIEAQNLREDNSALMRQANTDGLTNVGNRKCFDEALEKMFGHADESEDALGLIMVDADKFKNLNDTYGHQVGDAVLVEIARRLSAAVRGMDMVCRYGGEEFAILLPGASLKDVASIAERIRQALASDPFEFEPHLNMAAPLTVTASFGAAVFSPETKRVLSSRAMLIKAADRALYAAKEGGRNCVRVFRLQKAAA